MQSPVYAGYEAIEDDVHAVRKRETSRLWYRDRVTPQASGMMSQLPRSFLSGSTSGRIATGATTSSAAHRRGIA